MTPRALSRILALLALILPLPALAQPADDTTPEDASSDQRVKVAVVYDQPVYLENIQPHPSVIESQRQRIADDAQFQQWLSDMRHRILREHIFKLLSNVYIRENGLTASEAEINAFLAKERQVYQDVISQYEQQIRQLQKRAEQIHAEGKPVPDAITRDIAILQKRIENMKHQDVDRMALSDKERRFHEEAMRQRAASAVRSWKFNRLLHEQYGGRVVPMQLTYQPYEAYAAWLQVQNDLGNFQILDDDYEKAFWNHYNRQPPNALEPFEGMWDRLRWQGSGMP